MPSGSCVCGNLKYSYSGDPVMKAICHCLTCKKLSGSAYATALLLPEDAVTYTSGTPKIVDVAHETGMGLHINFCPDCGVSVGKKADGFKGMFILWSGTVDGDEKLAASEPQAELWVKYRADWVPELKGAKQCMEFE